MATDNLLRSRYYNQDDLENQEELAQIRSALLAIDQALVSMAPHIQELAYLQIDIGALRAFLTSAKHQVAYIAVENNLLQ